MSAIITTSDLATYTGKSLTTSIADLIVAGVNKFIEQYTSRCWGETTSVVTEMYDFKDIIWLRHPDVLSIDAITLGYPLPDSGSTQSIAPGNYWFNPLGRLTMLWGEHRPQSKWNNDLLAISYTYGVTDVPEDLFEAALGIAAVRYNYATNGQENIVSTSVGNYRIETINAIRGAGTGGPSPAANTAEAYFAVVGSYKMKRF